MVRLPPSFRLAVGTLTVWRTGAVEVTPAVARTAMLVAPLAVVPLAVLAAGAAWVSDALDAPDVVTGLLAVAVLAAGTRALHLDGLADTADGLGSGWDRQRALTVMRRGDVGPMGVVTLVLVLGLQAAAFGQLADSWAGSLQLAAVVCCSRAALSLACLRGVPAARSDGLGSAVAGSVPLAAAAAVWVGVAVVVTATSIMAGGGWLAGPVSVALCLAAVVGLLRHCVRRLGGVTGDVMGACVELAATVLAVGLVLQWP